VIPFIRNLASPRLLVAAFLLWTGWAIAFHEAHAAEDVVQAIARWSLPVGGTDDVDLAGVWESHAVSFLIFAVFQLACFRIGTRLAGWCRTGAGTGLALPLGWAVMAFAVLALGTTGLLNAPCCCALALVPAVLGPWRLRRRWTGPAWPRDFLSQAGLGTCVAGALVIAVTALAPETEVDALTYHLGRTTQMVLNHRLIPYLPNPLDDFPANWELLLAPLVSVGGEAAIHWFNPLLVVLLGAWTYRLCRRFMEPRWCVVAAALMVTSPWLAGAAVIAKNDVLAGALGLGAWMWAESAPAGAPARWLMAGLLCGAACEVKYPAGLILLPAVGAVALTRKPWRALAPFWVGAGFLAATGPMLVHRWLWTRDPVYPVAASLFGLLDLAATAQDRLRLSLYATGGQTFLSTIPQHLQGWWHSGPVEWSFDRWAVLLPGVLLAARRPAPVGDLLLGLGLMALGWFGVPPHVRYGSMLFPLGIALATYGLSVYPGRAGIWIAGALIASQLVHLVVGTSVAQGLRAGVGWEAAAPYRARSLGTLDEMANIIRRSVQPQARIFMHGETRGALFGRRSYYTQFSEPAFPLARVVHASNSPAQIWHRLRQL